MTQISFTLEDFLQNQVLPPENSLFILTPKIPNLTVDCFQALQVDLSAGEEN